MKLEAKTELEMRNAPDPRPKSMEDLVEYIESCLAAIRTPENADHEDIGDAYGRCVYAMSLSAVAAFKYVAHVEGVSGLQSSCAELDVLRRTRRIEGPFAIIDYSDLLYPQFDILAHIKETMESEDLRQWLREEARKNIATFETMEGGVAQEVLEHWRKLAA